MLKIPQGDDPKICPVLAIEKYLSLISPCAVADNTTKLFLKVVI
jgi:hypothetical protein